MVALDVAHQPVEDVYVAVDGDVDLVQAFLRQRRGGYGGVCVGALLLGTAVGAHVDVEVVAEVFHFFDEEVARAHEVLLEAFGLVTDMDYYLTARAEAHVVVVRRGVRCRRWVGDDSLAVSACCSFGQ